MSPTLSDSSIVLINRMATVNVGDIVITNANNYYKQSLIKRVVAVEGQTVTLENNTIYIDNQIYKELVDMGNETVVFELSQEEVFLLGDNINSSKDSRDIGPISRQDLLGVIM